MDTQADQRTGTMAKEVSFHLSLLLTGHGCFNDYLFRFGKASTKACSQCGASPDTAEHSIFKCDSFYHSRAIACTYLRVEEPNAENVVEIMLRTKDD